MQDFIGDFVATYIDDITVYSDNVENHLHQLWQVFSRLRQVKMN